MRKDADLVEVLNRLNSRLDEHVGSNGKSQHLPADVDRSGFMTPEQVLDLNEALGKRTKLDEGTDVLTLQPGKYWGINLVNSSYQSGDDGILMVDVAKAGDNYVQIKEWESVFGRLKTRTIHKNKDGENYSAPSGWATNERISLLWQGDVSTVGTTVVLNDLYTNYDKLIIYTDNHNGGIKGHKVLIRESMTLTDTQNFNGSPYADSYEVSLSLDKKSCKITFSNHLTIGSNGVTSVTTDLLSILKIEGVR